MSWHVDITIGALTWSITEGDAADPVDPGPLAGLTFGWSMPAGDVQPWQPDPMNAALQLIVSDIADIVDAGVDTGSPVAIDVKTDAGGPVVFEFRGRLSDDAAEPHPLGMLYSAIAVDDSVDERPVTISRPEEHVSDRLHAIFAAVGDNSPAVTIDPPGGLFAGNVIAREYVSEPLHAAVVPLLDTSLIGPVIAGPPDLCRSIFAPVVAGLEPAPPDEFAFDVLPESNSDPLPGVLALLADSGLWGIRVDVNPANLMLDACFVERSTRWARTKKDAVNQVQVAYSTKTADAVVTATGVGAPIVSTRLDSDLVGVGGAVAAPQAVADYYLPESGGLGRWSIESFRYLLYAESPALLAALEPGWMPVHSAPEGDPVRSLCYRRLVAIVGIPEHQNPAGVDYYAGQLQSVQLTLEHGINDGEQTSNLVLDFGVRRSIPLPADAANPLTWADLAAAPYTAVTWNQLDPRYTWADWRLATG